MIGVMVTPAGVPPDPMYMLDTNVCIDFARARSENLRDKMRENFASGLAISAITLSELRVGARESGDDTRDDELLDTLIRLIDVHSYDDAAADAYGRIARQIGIRRRNFDRLIAAHAVSLGLTLITRNARDFADVPGLTVENWTL